MPGLGQSQRSPARSFTGQHSSADEFGYQPGPARHLYLHPDRHGHRQFYAQRHHCNLDVFRPGLVSAGIVSGRGNAAVCIDVDGHRDCLGHRRHPGSRLYRHRWRHGYTATDCRRHGDLRRHLRRQDVTHIRHHQSRRHERRHRFVSTHLLDVVYYRTLVSFGPDNLQHNRTRLRRQRLRRRGDWVYPAGVKRYLPSVSADYLNSNDAAGHTQYQARARRDYDVA